VPLSADVQLFIEGVDPPLVRRGMVSTISLGGTGLYLAEPLESGVKVALENRFLVSGDEVKTEVARGTIINSNYIRDIYLVGVKFDQELSPRHQPHLYSRVQDIVNSY
jgi:c-di-GMP-binding flagellar brake protein YcgR